MDEQQAIAAATSAIEGKLEPDHEAIATATHHGDVWEVIWEVPGRTGRGPDFEAKVTLDALSGRVIEVLAGS